MIFLGGANSLEHFALVRCTGHNGAVSGLEFGDGLISRVESQARLGLVWSMASEAATCKKWLDFLTEFDFGILLRFLSLS